MKLRSVEKLLCFCAVGILSSLPSHSAPVRDPFDDVIRKTDALTPEQEQKTFHLPPGFEIQLVASEPEIGKPMNLAFDAKGRLWFTESREYPFPVLPIEKKGRDKIKILSNFDANGRAGAVTTFAEGLNIPIGLLPYKNGVIAHSIPYIHYFQDTTGSGHADKDEIIMGRIGFEKDTHGMTSNFRRGYDGLVYADHGFSNDSVVTAKDGSSITMNSGNCYRFTPDGSHVEQFTWGQVNPFGLMFDRYGDLWSADCHSAPTYVLMRGGYYPSFGKPNDGLGFAPQICMHQHGSTAIAGMIYYDNTDFPTEFRDNTFIGNVMTCKINRDSYVWSGSSRVAKEEPDFLSCDDPWFRPVTLQYGPDGAIYVADFYNRIIGHYEVPLDHPGRDRERGRIWRIVYKGAPAKSAGSGKTVTSELVLPKDLPGLLTELASPNITRRMLATDELVDTVGGAAIEPVKKLLASRESTPTQRVHALWILKRLKALEDQMIVSAAKDSSDVVRVHAMRVSADFVTPSRAARLIDGLKDSNAFVERAAADALGQKVGASFNGVPELLETLHRCPTNDTHLRYTVRMALRDRLGEGGPAATADVYQSLRTLKLSHDDLQAIAEVSIAVKTPESASFLLQYLQGSQESTETTSRYLSHAARYTPPSDMDSLALFARTKFADQLDFQAALFDSVQQGTAQRGAELSQGCREWGAELANKLIPSLDEADATWQNIPIEGMANTVSPWFVQQRKSSDGDSQARFICSLPPNGEQLTGRLRSRKFVIPASLSFYIAGHNGKPPIPDQKKNVVRLRDAGTQELIKEVYPPRNDVAKPVKWDLSASAGKEGYLEIIDADNGKAYAWLAVGRFDPAVLPLPTGSAAQIAMRQREVADLAASLKLVNLGPQLTKILGNSTTDLETRATVAKALVVLSPNENLTALAPLVGDATVPAEMRNHIADTLSTRDPKQTEEVLTSALRDAPYRVQVKLAQTLAGSPAGAENLLQIIERGQAAPRLLAERSVVDRLNASKPASVTERIEKLTKGLAPANEVIEKLLAIRRAGFKANRAKADLGAKVFEKNCMVCHQLDGKGAVIGPQLDGVGSRGLERLSEDVLDPNRNVDRAFRTHFITLVDGDVVSGLPRREEGEVLVLADSTGKEMSIAKKNIKSRRESETSLMPDNFGEVLSQEEFNHLMAFLMTKNGRPQK